MITAKFVKPNNGWDPDIKTAVIARLQKNVEYEVRSIAVFSYVSQVFLKGYDVAFNSVQFVFFEDGKPLNIYEDPRFDHYSR